MGWSRRRTLRFTALTVVAGVGAGCSGTDTTTDEPSRRFGPSRRRGTADAVSVSATFDSRYTDTDGRVWDENRTDAEPMPFERWARLQCLSLGAKHVRDRLVSRFDLDIVLMHDPPSEALSLTVRWLGTADGTVVSTPAEALDSLVAATPAAVTATVRLDGRSYSETMPVWVQQQQ